MLLRAGAAFTTETWFSSKYPQTSNLFCFIVTLWERAADSPATAFSS